jgi:MFS family permease
MMIASEAVLQIVNGAFLLVLAIYLKNKGYSDSENAMFVSYRFLSSMLLAAPMGLLIKGRKLIPFFKWSAILTPILSILIIYSTELDKSWLISLLMFLWGVSFTMNQVCKLPFIMRNCSPENVTGAITLNYATWSFGAIIAGVIISVLSTIDANTFNDKNLLYIISFLGFLSMIFAYGISKETITDIKSSSTLKSLKEYDWKVVIKALVPTFILATGAGLSIPFMNLFFNHVHGFSSADYSKLGSISFVLVLALNLFVPHIKDKMGYKKAIPLFQGAGILILILLACTEFFSGNYWAVGLAGFLFLARQPIMSTAQPMTTDLIMKYVGKTNQELVSAIYSTIWNGTFVVSALIFGVLRKYDVQYVYIFFVTAFLYIVGLSLYILLILEFEKRANESDNE